MCASGKLVAQQVQGRRGEEQIAQVVGTDDEEAAGRRIWRGLRIATAPQAQETQPSGLPAAALAAAGQSLAVLLGQRLSLRRRCDVVHEAL